MSNLTSLMVYYSQILHLTFCCNRNAFLFVEVTGATRNTTLEVFGCSFCWVGVCAKPARSGVGPRRAVIGKSQNDTLNPAWSD